MEENKCYQATPPETLKEQLMSWSYPKSELEWFALRTIEQLESQLADATERIAELRIQLAAADNGLLKASDPKSGWQGISKECKLWQEKYEAAAERERVLVEALESAKKFSDRLDFVHEHEDFQAIWFLAHSHYGDYKGPRYVDEFNELKAAIEAVKVKP